MTTDNSWDKEKFLTSNSYIALHHHQTFLMNTSFDVHRLQHSISTLDMTL